MSVDAHKETLGFQTEVTQVLDLMIHSLYSNKEIFLRELVSNASDAIDKLRFKALKDDALYEGDGDLHVRVSFDKDARTVTISDNGIGMDRDEVIAHIGTIAKSGTKEFFDALTGEEGKDSQLIGQFGVGFYSGFIVADKVQLTTRKAGLGSEHGVVWTSEGKGDYTLETVEKVGRGTSITLFLKPEEDEFLNEQTLKTVICKFSDHIPLPIIMKTEKTIPAPEPKEGEEPGEPTTEIADETINQASALWMRNKKDISNEEYNEFYKHIAHDFEDPMSHSHSRVEGKYEYTSLLYIPNRAPFDLWDRSRKYGLKLYVKRVFILEDAENLMPHYLRFVRGIIDSDDLPLNVSREILQHNKVIDSIRGANVKKVLGLLDKLAKDEEGYAKFWDQFGKVLKEGPAEDSTNKERIGKLLRFCSTKGDGEKQIVSLDDYISRMQEGQDKIYFVTAETFAAANSSPHLEIFRKKDIEVLLLHEQVDEWMTSHMSEYDGKTLQSVMKGELDLGDLDESAKEEKEKVDEEYKSMLEEIKKVLDDQVEEVRITNRLTDSPACLVANAHGMSAHLERMMKAAGQSTYNTKPSFELNPEHPLVARLRDTSDTDRFSDMAKILFDQALLAEGGQLADPAQYVSRLNKLLFELSGE
jgi:molecular chaperone HtpG